MPPKQPTWAKKQNETHNQLRESKKELALIEQNKGLRGSSHKNSTAQDIQNIQAQSQEIYDLKNKIAYYEADLLRINEAIQQNKGDQEYKPNPSKRDPTSKKYTESTGIEWEEFHVRGIPMRVGRKDGAIVDTQAKLTDEQHQKMLKTFDNKQRDYKTSSNTYVFQNELAAFERHCLSHPEDRQPAELGKLATDLRQWSTYYVKFEAMINNMHAFKDPMKELIKQLEKFIQEIEKSSMPEYMKDLLLDGRDESRDGIIFNHGARAFLQQAKDLRAKSPTPQEVRRFFSVQPEDTNSSIGEFISHQYTYLTESAMTEVYRIQDGPTLLGTVANHIKQGMSQDPLLRHLSDAGAYIERKRSAQGIIHNNSTDPEPDGMIAACLDNKNPSNDNPTWTSVSDYMDSGLHKKDAFLKQLDPLTQDIKEKIPKPGFGSNALAVLGGVSELVFGGLWRAVVAPAAMGIGYGVARTLSYLIIYPPSWRERTVNWINKKFDNGEKRIANHYREHAPLSMVKRSRQKAYSNELQKLEDPISEFAPIADKIRGTGVGKFIFNRIDKVGNSIGRGLIFIPKYLWSASYLGNKKFKKEVDQDVTNALKSAGNSIANTYNRFFNSKKYKQDKIVDFEKRAIEKFNAKMKGTHEPQVQKVDTFKDEIVRQKIEAWTKNEFNAGVVGIWDEVMTGVGDNIFSPLARHSRYAALGMFVFSHISFGVMVAPTAFASAGAIVQSGGAGATIDKALLYMSQMFGKGFMGKTVSAHAGTHAAAAHAAAGHSGHMATQASKTSMGTDALTALLEYKIPLLIGEGIKEMAFGDLLDEAAANPEKSSKYLVGFLLMTGLCGVMTDCYNFLPIKLAQKGLPDEWTTIHIGHSLPGTNIHIPGTPQDGMNIMNPVGEILSEISIEAAEVQRHGDFPFTTLELGFLGFKTVMVAHSMMEQGFDPATAEEGVTEESYKAVIALLLPARDEATGNIIEFKEGEERRGRQKLIHDIRMGFKEFNKDKEPKTKMSALSADQRKQIIGAALTKNGVSGVMHTQLMEQLQNDWKESCEASDKCTAQAEEGLDAFIKVSKANLEEKALKDLADPSSPPSETKLTPNPNDADVEREHLMKLVRFVQMWGDDPEEIDVATANMYYDELYYAFKAYNNKQRQLGHWDQQIDKNDFLRAFDRKFIEPHEKSYSIVQLLRAPFAWALGARSKTLALSPHRQQRVKKNAALEKTLGVAIVAPIPRLGNAYAESGASFMLGVGMLGVHLAAFVPRVLWTGVKSAISAASAPKGQTLNSFNQTWRGFSNSLRGNWNSVKNMLTFSPRKVEASREFKAAAARAAREASESSAHLGRDAKNIIGQLQTHKEKAGNKNEDTKGWTAGYNRKYKDGQFKNPLKKEERREEKDLLTRYAHAMSTLEQEEKDLSARVAAFEAENKAPLTNEKESLRIIRASIADYKTNPPKNEEQLQKRLNWYKTQIDSMEEIGKLMEPMEKEALGNKRAAHLQKKVAALHDEITRFKEKYPNESLEGYDERILLEKIVITDEKSNDQTKTINVTDDDAYMKRLEWITKQKNNLMQRRAELSDISRESSPSKKEKNEGDSRGNGTDNAGAATGAHLDSTHHTKGNGTTHPMKQQLSDQTCDRLWESKCTSQAITEALKTKSNVVAVAPVAKNASELETLNKKFGTQLASFSEIFDNNNLFEDDYVGKLNKDDIQMHLGGQQVFIKGFEQKTADGDTIVLYVKCLDADIDLKDIKTDRDKFPFVNASDVLEYANKHPSNPSFEAGVTGKLVKNLGKDNNINVDFMDGSARQQLTQDPTANTQHHQHHPL